METGKGKTILLINKGYITGLHFWINSKISSSSLLHYLIKPINKNTRVEYLD